MNKIIIRKDPKMQYNKHPKTIWITGASSGIGQEFARQFARKGDCRLILTARRKDRLHALADSLSCPCRIEPAVGMRHVGPGDAEHARQADGQPAPAGRGRDHFDRALRVEQA